MSRTRFTLSYDHENMVPAKAGEATAKTIYKTEDGVMHTYGTTVPTDATAGYAPGCLFHHSDADVLFSGVVDSGDATSLIDATLTATFDSDDELIGLYVINARNETMGLITDYTQSTGDITVADWTDYDGTAVSNAAPNLPVAADPFKVLKVSTKTAVYVNCGDRARGCRFRPLVDSYGGSFAETEMHRGPSESIWGNCPAVELALSPAKGMYMFDDFTDGFTVAASQNTAAASALGTTGAWTAATAATGGTTVSTLATNSQGVVVLSSTTDNEDAIICYPKGGHTAGIFKFTSGQKLWMEARIQVNSIGDAIAQLFIGFAEQGLVATTTLLAINEGGPADKDYVAFTRKYAASHGEMLDTVFNTASGGTTPIEVGADAAVLAATTWTKIGMYCDGTELYFYQDGILLDDSVTIADTDFPDGEEMAFYAAIMCGAAGTDGTLSLDWVAIAQEY